MSPSPKNQARTAASRRRRVLFPIVFAGVSLVLALAAAEVALRVFSSEVDTYHVWKPQLEMTFHPTATGMPGVEGEALFKVNSLGLRGDELSDDHDYRVLTVGGSTTECNFLDQPDTWPQGLADALNRRQNERRVWVGNAARSGLNARHNVVQLRYLLPQLPRIDLVIVLPGVNDLSVRLAKDQDYDPDYMQRDQAEAELMPRCFQVFPIQFRRQTSLLQRTALGRLLSGVKARLFPGKLVVDDAGLSYDVWRQHRQSASAIRETLPNLDTALDEYRDNLAMEIELCKARGARVLLLTQPSMWRADLPTELAALLWFGGVGDFQEVPGCEYYSVDALSQGMELYNSVVQEQAQQHGVECFDLAAALQKDGSVFYDDVHFTTAGARQITELLADYLLTRPPF